MIAFNLETTSVFSTYATDTDAENNGVWVDGKPPLSVRVRSTHSKTVREAQNRVAKRNLPYFKNGSSIPEALEAQNEAEVALACLVDWRGVTDAAGADVPFSPELAQQVIADPRFWEFRQFVLGAANNVENYRAANVAKGA